MSFSLDFQYAYGRPQQTALFRSQCEDFRVVEHLAIQPSGEGEHVYLYVQKRDNNTAWLAKQIAHLAGVKPMDVGYCGLKDRRAITQQWFSVYLPKGPEPDWTLLNDENFQVLNISRCQRKLRRGGHSHNDFVIRLRDIDASPDLEQRLAKIAVAVPNYFGEQRFGIAGNNLVRAQEWFEQGKTIKNRQQRGLIMSAARSYLFNLLLSARLGQGNWLTPIAGEVLLNQQITGPLWGRGQLASELEVNAIEVEILQPWQLWQERLEHLGLSQDRRILSLTPKAFKYRFFEGDLELSFGLAPGCYATAIMRELCQLQQPEIL